MWLPEQRCIDGVGDNFAGCAPSVAELWALDSRPDTKIPLSTLVSGVASSSIVNH